MKVLLLEDVDNLGLAGDVKDVAAGFGRNYLIPQQLAILATPGALKQAEGVRKAGELKRAREQADAEAIVSQIEGKVLVFERRAGERDRLYGSVTAAEIAQALSDEAGIEIDRRKISLPEPLRSLGEWDVTIRLMVGVSATIQVVIIAEGETYTPPGSSTEETAEGEAVVEDDMLADSDSAEAVAAAAEALVAEAVAAAEEAVAEEIAAETAEADATPAETTADEE